MPTAEGTKSHADAQGIGWTTRQVKNRLNLAASWEAGWSGRSS
jgi:hypothetical protein